MFREVFLLNLQLIFLVNRLLRNTLDNFEEYKIEYNQLIESLSSSEIMKDIDKFKLASSRAAQLRPIIDLIEVIEKEKEQLILSEKMLDEETDPELKELAEEDINTLKESIGKNEYEYQKITTISDPDDIRNAIVEVRAGTGGEEAALFANDIYRMYVRFAEESGWQVEQLHSSRTGNGGFKEIIILIKGSNVFGNLKYENGVHRVQRVPSTESAGRIHTSAISVVVLPEVDDIQVEMNEADLKIDVYRSSGPGGQSVNTTDSAVRITHIPTGIVVSCQDEKSQHKNKARAMSVMRSRLYELEKQKELEKKSDIRMSAIQSGDRSAKIRTYNFPQSRVTDHRIKKSWYNLSQILDGDITDIIRSLQDSLAQESNQ